MSKSILITGNAGLLGSRFAEWVLMNNPEYEVVGIDNLFGGYMENVDPQVVFYKRDLAKDSITDIFDKHEFDYVFHFAAYAPEGLSPFMRMFTDQNNILSTDNIINECVSHGVKKLIFTSSMAVYGNGEHYGKRFMEYDTPKPLDPYAVSKYACELNIRNAGMIHGLDWCILRPHNLYGRNQNIWDRYRNVIGIWMYRTLNNQPIYVYGDGNQTRAFSYVDDCLESIWLAATSDKASKQIINLGATKGYKIKEVAEMLCNITGVHNIEYKKGRYEVKHAVPSATKSKEILGYEDKTPLEEGLMKMWTWAKTQPNRSQFTPERYEIEKGIYDYWK